MNLIKGIVVRHLNNDPSLETEVLKLINLLIIDASQTHGNY